VKDSGYRESRCTSSSCAALDDLIFAASAMVIQVVRPLLGPWSLLISCQVGGVGGAGPAAFAALQQTLRQQAHKSAVAVAAEAAAEVKGAANNKGERKVGPKS
jgi:hypothetical protein